MAKRGHTSRREFLKESALAGGGFLGLRGLSSAIGGSAETDAPNQETMRPVALRCEYREDPLGIDALQPRLSWLLESTVPGARGQMQAAYEILAAGSEERLGLNQGDLWDTGKVESDRSTQVAYQGTALTSRQRVWWKVRVWDQSDNPSPWSEPARWSIGLLQASDWEGHWISGSLNPNEAEAVYLSRVADLPHLPARATAYICGLGYYELYLNSERVGDHMLDPGFTDYNKRVLYVTYDITRLLRAGKNLINVILGNGWYHPVTPDLFGFQKAPWREPPKLLVNIHLEYRDGSHQIVASDTSWKWARGPISFNCIRGGVTYDARLEKPAWNELRDNDSGWRSAAETAAPKGGLRAQMEPPIRVTETFQPVNLTEPKPNVYVFDLGVNLTGWARFKAHGAPGQKITLKYDLVLNLDGTVDMNYCHSHTYGRFQTDELILDEHGSGILEPRFTYHGFRYVQVEGLNYRPALSSLAARNVHTDWEQVGEFACSDPMINRMQLAVQRTLSECAHSMPGEEPTREKMGWTQDGQNTMEAAIYNFQAAPVYTNYLFDMIDAQQSNGSVPPIVPTDGWGDTGPEGLPAAFSDPWWGGTLPYVALKLHDYYSDRRALEEAYGPMKRWVEYLRSTAKGYLIDWGIGDWLEVGSTGRPRRTPVIQTSTAGYYYCVRAVVRAATLLGRADDAAAYEKLATSIKTSFNRRFLDPSTGLYAEDSQTSQALPLWLDMVPKGKRRLVLQRLIEDIHRHEDHMTTGFIGVMPMLHGLADWGFPDLAYKVAMQKDRPGFLWMVARGNTTTYESVDNLYGTDLHPFGSCIGSFFFREIAGIRPHPLAPGFRKIIIRPIAGDLSWAKARYDSVAGRVSTEWRREARRFTLRVSIPPNTSAVVFVRAKPPEAITESGRPIREGNRVKLLRIEGNESVFAIGSGDYEFAAPSDSDVPR